MGTQCAMQNTPQEGGSDGSYYTFTELYAQSCMVWMENETTKCTSTTSANLSLETCSINASMQIV